MSLLSIASEGLAGINVRRLSRSRERFLNENQTGFRLPWVALTKFPLCEKILVQTQLPAQPNVGFRGLFTTEGFV